ncbi:MAG: hypothetical protein ACRDFX_06470 [Chloroflexota bacterium]
MAVTPVTIRAAPKPTPRAAPTRFVPPAGPYIRLAPSSGLPVARMIAVRGANLPKSATVSLVWSPGGRASSLNTTSWTTRKGTIATGFSVPASPPGSYRISLQVRGVSYATSVYRVTSHASLLVSVAPGSDGDTVRIRGKAFLHHSQLLLVAYLVTRHPKPILLGSSRSSSTGRFSFQLTTRKLAPGEYTLRAYSTNALAAQMAETYFQVAI